MADFRRGRTFKTEEPLLKVDAGLPVGTYVFKLEVEDQNGNRSKAAKVELKVVEARDSPSPGGDDRIIVPPVVTRPPRNP